MRVLYTQLSLQIPNWNPARNKVAPAERWFIEENESFEKSQELKGRSEKFKNHVAVLS
jgi:hypothetical protein